MFSSCSSGTFCPLYFSPCQTVLNLRKRIVLFVGGAWKLRVGMIFIIIQCVISCGVMLFAPKPWVLGRRKLGQSGVKATCALARLIDCTAYFCVHASVMGGIVQDEYCKKKRVDISREVIYERARYLTRLRYLIKDSLLKELDKPSMIVMDDVSYLMLPLPTYFPGFNLINPPNPKVDTDSERMLLYLGYFRKNSCKQLLPYWIKDISRLVLNPQRAYNPNKVEGRSVYLQR